MKLIWIIICSQCMSASTSMFAQQDAHTSMKTTTRLLINKLKQCDTAGIFKMFDTAFSHIDRRNYKDFIAADVWDDCMIFRKIIKKYGMPDPDKIKYLKDKESGANIVDVSLLDKKDSSLNLKKCDLLVIFYPDELYDKKPGKFLRYSINQIPLNPPSYKITIPGTK